MSDTYEGRRLMTGDVVYKFVWNLWMRPNATDRYLGWGWKTASVNNGST
jgi:hypothetical protein